MNNYSDLFMWAVVIVAFIAGYSMVSFIIRQFKGEHSNAKNNSDSRTANYSTQQEGHFRKSKEEEARLKEEGRKTLSEEQQYAEILGLKGPFTVYDVKKVYRQLLGKYHPDKVSHLGDEFKQIAEQKTREIVAAYEYFYRKYKIT